MGIKKMNILQQILEGFVGGGASKKSAPAAKQAMPLAHLAQPIPVGQSLTPENIAALSPDVQGLAQIYNTNPQDPRVAGVDPAMFGYAPDETVAPMKPWTSPITGAFDPRRNVRKGGTVYSPGAGPFIPSKSRPGNGSEYQ